jgi:hypothetical protein
MKPFRTRELFERPIPPDRIRMREIPARWPASTHERVLRSWRRELRTFCGTLGPGFEIRPYENGWPAVFRGDRPVLWPGRVFALESYSLRRTLTLNLAAINFAWVSARSVVSRTFGIVTFAIASDDKIILTVRGDRANLCPHQLHGNGGNPDRIEPVQDHQFRETEEEILVPRSDIVPGSMRFGGISETLVYPKLKPNLCGWLRLSIPSREVLRRVRSRPLDDRPGDAVDVETIDCSPDGIDAMLSRRKLPMCPSGAAGLAILRHHLFGGRRSGS